MATDVSAQVGRSLVGALRCGIGLCIAVFGSIAMAQASEPITALGFRNVADAMASLKANPANRVVTVNDWTVVSEGVRVLWSFAPASYPAYPAAVRRVLTMGEDRKPKIEMHVYCEASPAACEALVREFPAINERIRATIEQQQGSGK